MHIAAPASFEAGLLLAMAYLLDEPNYVPGTARMARHSATQLHFLYIRLQTLTRR
ncbi:hypothetical protein Q9Q94_07160 [Uliginosibacterium sp. 31-16]|uniref:hypothetical protein n=1 Tax=Uliginosibacterium sp. 31-16 TaxID=3068315 RepID=UPI00273E3497|nr:hypothetical protein [Uliginosibacterium sp. 31-16]MDP5239302.1 hypothetical protein [Uliginosibacterium sp. 31-16]